LRNSGEKRTSLWEKSPVTFFPESGGEVGGTLVLWCPKDPEIRRGLQRAGVEGFCTI